MRRYTLLVIGLLSLTTMPASTGTIERKPLTVHEWGTFTSIAGADGAAVDWIPQAGPTDLPCFVERNSFNIKGRLSGTVRMETPVLYFYAERDTTVEVNVQFRQGVITEWFPHAVVTPAAGSSGFGPASAIAWHGVKVSPAAVDDSPNENAPSHYYAARRTQAAPLAAGSETEKFLFYRGVGRFLPSIAATVDDRGSVVVTTPPGQPVGDIILFTNDRGRMAYEVQHAADVSVDPRIADRLPTSELERLLLSHGLFPAETRAMFDTWRDAWFEEGTRLFYIVPSHQIEAILPLQITPPPAAIARVFVGRMELITPRTLKDVKAALLANDAAALRRHGRFLEAIGRRIVAESPRVDRALLERRLEDVSGLLTAPQDECESGAANVRSSRN